MQSMNLPWWLLFAVCAACSGDDSNPVDAHSTTSGGQAGVSGAGQAGAASLCVPGRSLACAGPEACPGYQTCEKDGMSFGPCMCSPGKGGQGGQDSAGKGGAPSGGQAGHGGAGTAGTGQAGFVQGGTGQGAGMSGSSTEGGQAGQGEAGTSGSSGQGGEAGGAGSGGGAGEAGMAGAGEGGAGGGPGGGGGEAGASSEGGTAGVGQAGSGSSGAPSGGQAGQGGGGQGDAGAGGAGEGGTTSGGAGQGGALSGGQAGQAGEGGGAQAGAGQAGAGQAGTAGQAGAGGGPPVVCEPQGTGPGVSGDVETLDFTVVDAEYSVPLQAIVAVSDQSSLRVLFPWSGAPTLKIPLPKKALSVSVAPDGVHAAVGHDGYLSLVDLCSGSVVPYPVSTVVGDVVLGGNGFAYAFPQSSQLARLHVIELSTGQETLSGGNIISGSAVGKLHPEGEYIYAANRDISPDDIFKFDVSSGPATMLYDSPYHGTYPMCGDLWLSDDGKRIFTRCGNVFQASSSQPLDMTYAGSLGSVRIGSLAQSAAANRVVVLPLKQAFSPVPTSTVAVYTYAFLEPQTTLTLPPFAGLPALGQFVFLHKDGTRIVSLVKADPATKAVNNQGIVTMTLP